MAISRWGAAAAGTPEHIVNSVHKYVYALATVDTTIDFIRSNLILVEINQNDLDIETLTFENVAEVCECVFVIKNENDDTDYAITWPDSFTWDDGRGFNGDVPTLRKTNVIKAITVNAGATWRGTEIYSVNISATPPIEFLDSGPLWSWGRNSRGTLGDGTSIDTSWRSQIGIAMNWAKVWCGDQHTLAIRTDGTLWAWGWSIFGQTGKGRHTSLDAPSQVGSYLWKDVSLGDRHTVAIRQDGSMYAFGRGNGGRLGHGHNRGESYPIQVASDTDWDTVACGKDFSVALKTDGTMWAWGNRQWKHCGKLYEDSEEYDIYNPSQIETDSDWAYIESSHEHNFAIKDDGTLWTWGINRYGGCGRHHTVDIDLPEQVGALTDWSVVKTGEDYTIAIKTDGTMWGWGKNIEGQLGFGDTISISSPVQLGVDTDWWKVSCGKSHVMATRTDGSLWAWGKSNYGQLGCGYTGQHDVSSPVQVDGIRKVIHIGCGREFSIAIGGEDNFWITYAFPEWDDYDAETWPQLITGEKKPDDWGYIDPPD